MANGTAIAKLEEEVAKMEAAVDENEEVDGSVGILLEKLSGIIRDGAQNPAVMLALADRLSAKSGQQVSANQRLRDAVAAHTPVDPNPEPEPEV